MSSGTTPAARSRSQSKRRSSTNLSNLRLAPLSSKYEASKGDAPLKSPLRTPYDVEAEASFARRHPSYLQGQSAPTTPGILSRSSSRKHLGGGLSRRGSLYDTGEDADSESGYAYGGSSAVSLSRSGAGRDRPEIGSGNIPKAKSDAVLLLSSQHDKKQEQLNRLSGPGVPLSQRYRYSAKGRRSGTATPLARQEPEQDSWLTHTGAMTSAIVREDKGLSWVATRQSSTSLAPHDSEEDEDDDHYEEMAALSASTVGLRLAEYDGLSPVSTRVSRSNWGSRYGSRSVSRRTSRIASPVGTRTPRRSDQPAYFDYPVALPTEQPGFIPTAEQRGGDGADDEKEIAQLSNPDSFALGNIVDRVVNFNLFNVNEHVDSTDDEAGNRIRDNETDEEAQQRREAEVRRRKEEKDMLTKQPPPAPLADGKDGTGDVGGWQDAAWLLSVATKALF